VQFRHGDETRRSEDQYFGRKWQVSGPADGYVEVIAAINATDATLFSNLLRSVSLQLSDP
jgi:hypothetical protein